MFGHAADSLEKGTEADDEYMISDKELLVNKFISIPKDMGHFNPGAYVAGAQSFYIKILKFKNISFLRQVIALHDYSSIIKIIDL